MELKHFFAQDIEGNVIPNATVYVYNPGTTTIASGLEDKDGNDLPIPFYANEDGLIQFAAPNGIYDLRVVSGLRDYTLQVQAFDAEDAESLPVTAAGTQDTRTLGEWVTGLLPANNVALIEHHKTRMHNGDAVRVACFGDSITAGKGGETTSYPAALQYQLRQYYTNANIEVYNLGVGGDTTEDLINRYIDVTNASPDIVLVMVGMNDSRPGQLSVEQYVDNLGIIYRNLRRDGYAVLAGDITPRKRLNNSGPEQVDMYRRAMRASAAQHGIPVVPMYDAMKNLVESPNGYSWVDLSTDGIHYNDTGYEQLAGAWLAYGLASASLAMRPREQLDVAGPWAAPTQDAIISYNKIEDNAQNAKETATLVYTSGTSNESNLRLFLWVEDYEFSDLVIYATRGYDDTYAQRVLLSNASIPDSDNPIYELGEVGEKNRAVAVPFRASKLRPGLNIINLRVKQGEKIEISKISVSPLHGQNKRWTGVFQERYSGSVENYSSSNGQTHLDYNITPAVDVGRGVLPVQPGQRVALGHITNNTEAVTINGQNRYRVRALLRDKLVLELGIGEWPGREYTPIVEVAFYVVDADTITMTSTFRGGSGQVVLGSQTIDSSQVYGDVKITIRCFRDKTDIYLNSATEQALVIPFVIGPCELIARNDNSSSVSYFNSLLKLGNSTYHEDFDGETFFDFTNKKFSYVIGGVIYSANMTA